MHSFFFFFFFLHLLALTCLVSGDVPESQPRFPLPYKSAFETETIGQQPKYWSQMLGAFELTQEPGHPNLVFMRQSAPQQPLDTWHGWSVMMAHAQMLKCTNKCSNAQINAQMLKCSNAQMHNAQLYKCPNVQMLKCTNA